MASQTCSYIKICYCTMPTRWKWTAQDGFCCRPILRRLVNFDKERNLGWARESFGIVGT